MILLIFVLICAAFFIPLRMLIPSATAIIIHELGHIIAIYTLGGSIEKISLSAFGLTIKKRAKTTSYTVDALISASGCFMNLLTSAVFFFLFGYSAFVTSSIIYAVFNILPVSALDGGCALYALICNFSANEETAGRILKITSGVTMILLWISGIYLILRPECSPSLFFMTVYLFSSVYLK